MTSLSSKFKNLGPQKNGERIQLRGLCLFNNILGSRPGNFLYCESGIGCFGRNCY